MTGTCNALLKCPSAAFNLRQTLESGQVFHWHHVDDGYLGLIGDQEVQIEQRGEYLQVIAGQESLVSRYFALDHPLEEISATFPEDPAMREAVAYCRGLRIMRQEPWECLATFITSALKQVPHIRKISLTLRERYGRPVGQQFSYPLPRTLAQAGEMELRRAGLGFRAKNLAASAQMVADGTVNLEALKSMSTTEARAELCRLPGVGEKVANCVLLFSYERLEAFPIDVWIERVLRELYFPAKRK